MRDIDRGPFNVRSLSRLSCDDPAIDGVIGITECFLPARWDVPLYRLVARAGSAADPREVLAHVPTHRILIFDNDGTLVPSHEVANPAIQRAFARYVAEQGIDAPVPTDQRIRELTGLPGDEFYRQLLPESEQHRAADLRSHCLDEEVAEVLRERPVLPRPGGDAR